MSNLRLRKFPINNIKDTSTVGIICRRGGGKSFLTRAILYHKRDIPVGCVISPTEQSNNFYSAFVPPIFIHDDYSPALMKNFMKRQHKVTGMKKKKNPNIDNRAFLVMDDCMYDARAWSHDKEVRKMIFNGRHDGILSIIILQYAKGLPPSFRDNFDFVFILRSPFAHIRRKLYEEYAGMFPTFEVFCKVMDVCTEQHGCIVIDSTTKSNKLEDQVFWYRAQDPGDFKIGADQFWQHNYDNAASEEEEEDENAFDDSQFRRKKVDLNIERLDYSD